ncbi:unnamed protein product [Rhizoctonia solani]|uniref:F-box domain-containing protein n=1 Tax=Rhizoctonia solani TaxID=456999 RepID=A0A8H3GFT3_9AGAM|nr:unnamed protein product [Rhizoctonia solani]
MRKCVDAIYSGLRNVMLVCSAWRMLAISQTVLWEVMPVFGRPSNLQAIKVNLPRVGNRPVRLTTIIPWGGVPSHIVDMIAEHTHRFRAFNVEGEEHEGIFDFITRLIRDSAPTQLSELSVRHTSHSSKSEDHTTFSFPESSYNAGLDKWIGSLSVLLLDRVQLRWENTSFSDRLVELAIHRVKLEHSESSMTAFVLAISSATRLRDLSITSVEVCDQSTQVADSTIPSKSLFPNLQSLSLRDLWFDVLELFLLKIVPGSYRLTLVLTEKVVGILDEFNLPTSVGVDKLVILLSHVQVNTLILDRGHSTVGPWLDGLALRRLLDSTPRLEELGIHGWRFDGRFCRELLPSPNSDTDDGTPVFPRVDKLHLTAAKILDAERFKHILANISTRTVVLGGRSRAGELSMDELHLDKKFADWLKCNVPGARLVSSGFLPAVMRIKEWLY